jgi:hypothetical protein
VDHDLSHIQASTMTPSDDMQYHQSLQLALSGKTQMDPSALVTGGRLQDATQARLLSTPAREELAAALMSAQQNVLAAQAMPQAVWTNSASSVHQALDSAPLPSMCNHNIP